MFISITIHCAKSRVCKEYFVNDPNDINNVSFNIITHENVEGNTMDNYSFVINDDNLESAIHAFILQDVGDKLYEVDDSKVYNEMCYNSVKLLYIDSNVFKKILNMTDNILLNLV